MREITSRLTTGLEKKIPDLEKRVEHILSKQVFGITKPMSLLARLSVYCSKNADGEHFIAKSLKSKDGKIWFESSVLGRNTLLKSDETLRDTKGQQEWVRNRKINRNWYEDFNNYQKIY